MAQIGFRHLIADAADGIQRKFRSCRIIDMRRPRTFSISFSESERRSSFSNRKLSLLWLRPAEAAEAPGRSWICRAELADDPQPFATKGKAYTANWHLSTHNHSGCAGFGHQEWSFPCLTSCSSAWDRARHAGHRPRRLKERLTVRIASPGKVTSHHNCPTYRTAGGNHGAPFRQWRLRAKARESLGRQRSG